MNIGRGIQVIFHSPVHIEWDWRIPPRWGKYPPESMRPEPYTPIFKWLRFLQFEFRLFNRKIPKWKG